MLTHALVLTSSEADDESSEDPLDPEAAEPLSPELDELDGEPPAAFDSSVDSALELLLELVLDEEPPAR